MSRRVGSNWATKHGRKNFLEQQYNRNRPNPIWKNFLTVFMTAFFAMIPIFLQSYHDINNQNELYRNQLEIEVYKDLLDDVQRMSIIAVEIEMNVRNSNERVRIVENYASVFSEMYLVLARVREYFDAIPIFS